MSTSLNDSKLVELWARDPELAKKNLRTLVHCLAQDEESIVSWATEALENCGKPSVAELGWLTEELHSDMTDIAYWAATLLGRLGPEGSSAQVALSELLSTENVDGNVRIRAAWAIGRIGVDRPEARKSLEEALGSNVPRLVQAAKESLSLLR